MTFLNRFLFLFIITFLSLFQLKAQMVKCDSVYVKVDQVAIFEKGAGSLMRYLNKNLANIFPSCYDSDSMLVSRLTFNLIINLEGQVQEATVSDADIDNRCREQLIDALKKMPPWVPAKVRGQAVCSRYTWPISCILWQR